MVDFLIRGLARVLVPLFFLGMAGSLGVIAISFVQDLAELFGEDEPHVPETEA